VIGMLEEGKRWLARRGIGILYYLLSMIPRDCNLFCGIGGICAGVGYLYLRRK
jgi:hypothetical protein